MKVLWNHITIQSVNIMGISKIQNLMDLVFSIEGKKKIDY